MDLDNKAYRRLVAGQIVFVGMMAVGYLIRPKLAQQNRGVSNFWFKRNSAAAYIAGFTASSLGSYLAVKKSYESKSKLSLFDDLMLVQASSALAVLFTSPLLRTRRQYLHYLMGSLMFSQQLGMGSLIVLKNSSTANLALLGLQAIGVSLSALTATTKRQLMFIGQAMAQAGFISQILIYLRPKA